MSHTTANVSRSPDLQTFLYEESPPAAFSVGNKYSHQYMIIHFKRVHFKITPPAGMFGVSMDSLWTPDYNVIGEDPVFRKKWLLGTILSVYSLLMAHLSQIMARYQDPEPLPGPEILVRGDQISPVFALWIFFVSLNLIIISLMESL